MKQDGDRADPIPVSKLKIAKQNADEINLLPETLDQCTAPEPDFEDGLTIDEKYLAISRLEVSGRTRSSEGERNHTVDNISGPKIGLRYGWVTQAGFYPEDLNKKNQDNLLVAPDLGAGMKNMSVFGVFDGHGKHGTECSSFAVDRFSKCLLAHKQLHEEPEAAIEDSLNRTNREMHKAKKKRKGSPGYFDDTLAGTTAINVLFINDEIVVANVGDSRAIIASDVEGKLTAQALSVDQTPYRKDERDRCKAAGAVVMTMDQLEGYKAYNPDADDWGDEEDDGGDPPRLWLPNKGCPGVAFTRSLGDEMAESIGVIAKPEVVRRTISPFDRFIVIASDGVFEFLSSQTVADMVQKFNDPYEAARALVAESYKLWLHYEVRTDDITVIVIFLNHPEAGATDDGYQISTARSKISGSFRSLSQVAKLEECRPVRREMSRKKRQIIEASTQIAEAEDDVKIDGKQPTPTPRSIKTPHQIEQIKGSITTNFLFQHLNQTQLAEVLNAFEVLEVSQGTRVIEQGDPGDKFFVVGSGDFDCFIKQAENEEESKILTYSGRDSATVGNPSFGELALMYSKPRAASVVAKTDGVLYALDRVTFRRVLVKRPNKELIQTLRKVQIFESLGKSQLQRLADALSEVTFSDGELILKQADIGDTMYIIKEGEAKVTINEKAKVKAASMKRSNTLKDLNDLKNTPEMNGVFDFNPHEAPEVMRVHPGDYFGEKALLNTEPRAASVIAVGNVKALSITRESFEDVLGPLSAIINRHGKKREAEALAAFEMEENLRRLQLPNTLSIDDIFTKYVVQTSDTMVFRIAVFEKDREKRFTLKSFDRKKIEASHTEVRVLRDRELLPLATVNPDYDEKIKSDKLKYVFPIMKTFVGQDGLHMAIQGIICGPLIDFMNSPFSTEVARFVSANVVSLISNLHKKRILLRSINPSTLYLDDEGYIRLADMGSAKYLVDESERAFTLCGDTSYFAPEQVLNNGHGTAVDFWSMGVLLFEMLTGHLPFTDEDPFSQIAMFKPQDLAFPESVPSEAKDLIQKLMQPVVQNRLTDCEEIKAHPFFIGIDWDQFRSGTVPSPLKDAAVSSMKEILASPTPRDSKIDQSMPRAKIASNSWYAQF